MNGPKKLMSVVVEKKVIAEGICLVVLEIKEKLVYKPGQYISLRVSEEGHRRSYSVAKYENNKISLIVDVSPKGLGSLFVEKLEVGSEVEVLGFLGNFTIESLEKIKNVYFVATGTGIVPFGPMVEMVLGDGYKGKVFLSWGLRHVGGLYWMDYLEGIKKKYSNFDFEIYLSKPEVEWRGKVGHVGDNLDLLEIEESAWYLCGGNEMISQMKERLVAKGVAEENINYEKFY
ncbi:MAG: hypothetical protein ACD_22C00148G0006 [uncultured bacterium]|nr:MAG: hypothetical protein ACD_22C00148G0006 [uncultured bacterium]